MTFLFICLYRLPKCIWIHRLYKTTSNHDRSRILGYPTNATKFVGNIYSNSTTKYTREFFGTTKPIHIQQGTIQQDILSPYLFLLFLEPLVRWLHINQLEYTFQTSKTQESSLAWLNTNNKHSKIVTTSINTVRNPRFRCRFVILLDEF